MSTTYRDEQRRFLDGLVTETKNPRHANLTATTVVAVKGEQVALTLIWSRHDEERLAGKGWRFKGVDAQRWKTYRSPHDALAGAYELLRRRPRAATPAGAKPQATPIDPRYTFQGRLF